MLKTKKNLIVVMLCVLLLLLCSVGLLVSQTNIVYAAESSNIENFQMVFPDYGGEKVYATYNFIKLNDEECSIEIKNKDVANIAEIPLFGIIDDEEYTVTEIADNGAMSASNLVEVKLTPYIKKIGNMAFANCTKLKYISLFNVNEICNNAFFRCPELETIIIPTSVKVMGSFVFNKNNTQVEVVASQADCQSWTSTWNFGNSLKENYESTAKDYVRGDIMQQNISRAKNNSEENIKGIIITYYPTSPNGLGIADPGIYDKGEENITIPPEAKYVDGNPYPILAIDDNSFAGSVYNNLIILYSDLPIFIDSNTFISSKGNNVIFNRSVIYRTIEETSNYESLINGKPSTNIFTSSTIKSVILPNDSEIPANMFRECKELENIFFKEPCTYVVDENGKDEAGQLIDILEDFKSKASGVEIPVQVKAIGDNAFRDARKISYLKINEKMQKVGSYIVGGWNSSQTVHVQNTKRLTNFNSETGLGWKSDWYNKEDKVNITFDKYLFTMIFDAGEGKIVEKNENGETTYSSEKEIEVEYDKAIGDLPSASRDGYAFRGWEYDSEYKEIINSDYANAEHTLKVKQNLTVKAVWSPIYTVTLKSEDGNKTYGSVEVGYLEDFATINVTDETLAVLSKKGYLLSFDLKGISYLTLDKKEKKLKSANVWNIPENGSVYATWKPIEYTVIYEADFKGHDNYNKKKFSMDKDAAYRFLTVTDVTLHERLYWEHKYFGDMNLDNAGVDNTITLKGSWGEIVTDITYNLNGGEYKNGEYPTSIKYSESKKIGEPYRYMYAFEGWYVQNVEGELLNLSILGNRLEEEINLVAKWGYRSGVSKLIAIPNNVSSYTIKANGNYVMPTNYPNKLDIIIEPGVNKVHLLKSSYLTYYYNTTITIKAYKYGYCNLYLENLYIKAPEGQAAIFMCYVESSSSSSGSSSGIYVPYNPYVTPVVPPITGPTFPPIIQPTSVNYSLASTYDFAKEISSLNLFAYGKVEVHGGDAKNNSSMNAGCAIFCENLHIRHADNLKIKGGDADEYSGNAGYGITAVYSVYLNDYDYDFMYANNIVEVLGGDKTNNVKVGSFIFKEKTSAERICILHAS